MSASDNVHERLILRMRALMSRTVANGASPEEEMTAARMVCKIVHQIEGTQPPPAAAPSQPQPWAKVERESQGYQQVLEKNTTEALLKSAVLELSLAHLRTVGPHRRPARGEPFQRWSIHDILQTPLSMAMRVGTTRLGREILHRTVEELVHDGDLPPHLDMPVER